jgi:hypothetical protein
MTIYTLYLGRNIPDTTKKVSDDEIQDFLKSIVSTYFPGFTIYEAVGFWKGEQEKTLIIEIITNDQEKVNLVANYYKVKFKQDSVLIKETDQIVNFI